MSNTKKIRLATRSDTVALLEIYAPYVRETAISFEYEVPSVENFTRRISKIQTKYPWLVCEIDNQVIGYAYASPYHERAAYQWSVDASVYIHPDYHRQKIGKALYVALFELLKYQGFYNVYAIITSANEKSCRFHETFGFKPVGKYHHVGYKFNQWHDVSWLELTLAEHVLAPEVPKTISEIQDTPEFHAIITKALQIIAD